MYALNPYLRDFWVSPARYKALYGGRASSKSHDAAGFSVELARQARIKFLCARQFQNRISESVYTLIVDKIEAAGALKEFEITKNEIIHRRTRSNYLFYGIARNLNEIKSTEGIDILWLEEANYLTKEQFEVLDPTIRKNGSQIWLIWNPDEYTDFIYQKFVVNTPEDCVKRLINWTKNPFLSETMIRVIHQAYKDDPINAARIYGGLPNMSGDKSVIPMSYVVAAIDAHKKVPGWKVEGRRKVGFDIADDGGDLNAVVDSIENVIVAVETWQGLEDELLKSCSKVYNYAYERNASITYDSIGVGAHAGSKFAELNDALDRNLVYEPFNAGAGVEDPEGVFMKLPHVDILNKEHFSNIKAQKWDEIATRFRKTYEVIEKGKMHPTSELISIDSTNIDKKTLDALKMELAAPRKDVDNLGKFKVESKKDMRDKRGIKSPNMADALIMSQIKPKRDAAGWFDMF